MKTRIGIITPGGDAPGMNACIRAIVRSAINYGYEPIGIYRGYQGLIEGDFVSFDTRSVSGIIHHGGTILKSSRCKEIKTQEGINKAVTQLTKNKIETLFIIGGDGSIKAGYKLSQNGISVIAIPASIDNDVYGTDETIGFDTAIDTAVDAIDKIRDTATSFDRIFVIEVMGREHGFLAVSIGLASGAEFVIIPEIKYDINKICLELVKDKLNKKTSEIIIFAEGAGDSKQFAKILETKTKISTRVSSLGYIQRGGSPSARSRILASVFGNYAVTIAHKNIKNSVVVIKNNKVSHIPLKKVFYNEKKLDKNLINLLTTLST